MKGFAIACLACVSAVMPLQAQTSSTGTDTSNSSQKPADNTALNNHGQGANNNQTRNGGDNGERRTGKTGDTSGSTSGSQ